MCRSQALTLLLSGGERKSVSELRAKIERRPAGNFHSQIWRTRDARSKLHMQTALPRLAIPSAHPLVTLSRSFLFFYSTSSGRPARAASLRQKMASTSPPTSPASTRSPLLVVLDLNGTLLDRITDGERLKRSRLNPKCPPVPDLVINGKKIYYRPYLDAFLHGLFDRFSVATWTSAMPKNAQPMVGHLFPKKLKDKLSFNWTREKCELLGNAREHQSIKDLAKIWADEKASINGKWNEKNTIIIDDSMGKGARNPFNAVHLIPFTVTEPDFLDCDADSTLLAVLNYLDHLNSWLAEDSTRDVRDFIREFPLYVGGTDLNASPSASASTSSDSSVPDLVEVSGSASPSEASVSSPVTNTPLLELAARYIATESQIAKAESLWPRHRRDTPGFTRHWMKNGGPSGGLPGEPDGDWDKSHKKKDLERFKPAPGPALEGPESHVAPSAGRPTNPSSNNMSRRHYSTEPRQNDRPALVDREWRSNHSDWRSRGSYDNYQSSRRPLESRDYNRYQDSRYDNNRHYSDRYEDAYSRREYHSYNQGPSQGEVRNYGYNGSWSQWQDQSSFYYGHGQRQSYSQGWQREDRYQTGYGYYR